VGVPTTVYCTAVRAERTWENEVDRWARDAAASARPYSNPTTFHPYNFLFHVRHRARRYTCKMPDPCEIFAPCTHCTRKTLGQSDGTKQHYSYALTWPSFPCFAFISSAGFRLSLYLGA
jgi:hypothetical protein